MGLEVSAGSAAGFASSSTSTQSHCMVAKGIFEVALSKRNNYM